MENSEGFVLEYSSIRADAASKPIIAPAMVSLALATIPFIGWALNMPALVFVAFVIFSWLGFVLGVAGTIGARGQPIAVAAAVIGALVNGAMAAFVLFVFTHGGLC